MSLRFVCLLYVMSLRFVCLLYVFIQPEDGSIGWRAQDISFAFGRLGC